jgi:hypothetical protein
MAFLAAFISITITVEIKVGVYSGKCNGLLLLQASDPVPNSSLILSIMHHTGDCTCP